jgi:16S rRNA A1518/A1519 N6-dimethyltransferase RsmA/KsgA/DIM1 with predicted DNA glycosylase/AP lyase activity
MGIFIILTIVIIVILYIFSSPTLSPIPYFPSQKVDIPLIIKALNLTNNQTVIDLGAGDGIVIFAAAQEALKKKLNTKFIAIEINPVLLLIMYIKKIFHPNRKNIKIVYADMFKLNFKKLLTFDFSLLTFYLYISPWFLKKVITNINSQLATNKQQLTIVSYMYTIKSLKEKERIIQGKNKIFVYQI